MPPEPSGPAAAAGSSEPEISLASALDLLQRGREGEALEVLDRLDTGRPDSVAARLRRQIETPIEDLIPGPYETITIEAGETLSEIALRVLGDPLMFHALARLNRIEEPRRVAAGATIRVPGRVGEASAETEPVSEPVNAPRPRPSGDSRAEDIDTVARYLARSGRPDEGLRMLLLEIESGASGDALGESFTELTLTRVDQLLAEERFEEAGQRLTRAIQALGPENPNQPVLERKTAEVRGEDLLFRARRVRTDGNLVEAHRLAREASRIGELPAAAALAENYREQLIDSLHNDALIAWRDRDVDRAIRLWETLLESVPDFEPARVYLERARRLRARLDRS